MLNGLVYASEGRKTESFTRAEIGRLTREEEQNHFKESSTDHCGPLLTVTKS